MEPIRLLIIEDSDDDFAILLHELKKGGIDPVYQRVQTEEALRAALETGDWHVVVSDFSLPGFSGLEALKIVRMVKPDLPFILTSGTIGEESAVEAMRTGANDYMMKDNLARLVPAIQREVREYAERKRLAAELGEAEEKLRQALKLEAVGQLAGGVAHDFNNVIAAIMLYTESILETDPMENAWRSNVEQIRAAGERAASLVRQLLVFSRRQVFNSRVLNLNSAVNEIMKMLSRLIGENIKIEARLQPGLWNVRSDPTQLEQVLLNLSINARDAMPQGGTLELATRNAALDSAPASKLGLKPGDYVVLEVQDTGTGMSDEVKSRIFDPFFTTKGPGKGTGLGLSTVYGIVHKSAGAIEVRSTVGRGTAFSIYLPRFDGAEEFAPERTRVDGKTELRATILLVEDDEALRMAIRSGLERRGLKVLVAQDGEHALEVASASGVTVDLLVTDVVMPGIGGIELSRQIEKSWPEMRTLFVSGYSRELSSLQELEEEKVRFLAKPFTVSVLVERIRELCLETR